MTELYLINIESSPVDIEEPIKADEALTLDREVWIWGLKSKEAEFDLPDRGDIAIFYSETTLMGVGEVWDSSVSKALTSYFDQVAVDGYSDADSVISLVNYQRVHSWEPGWVMDLFDIPDELGPPARWMRDLPEIYKVPRERFAGTEENTRLIVGRLPINTSIFGSLPPNGGRNPPDPERPYSPDDGDGGLGSVDWTGPLLAQQYANRDMLQEAAKGSVQIIILLFGIMIAALSLIRKAPSEVQDASGEALSITLPLLGGLVGISAATLASALLLTITAAQPRPFSRQIAEKQSGINSLIKGTTDLDEKSELLNDFSVYYHNKIMKIQQRNGMTGAGIGGTIGVAIASITLFGFETLVQIFPKYGDYWSGVVIFTILSLLLIPIGLYIALPNVGEPAVSSIKSLAGR